MTRSRSFSTHARTIMATGVVLIALVAPQLIAAPVWQYTALGDSLAAGAWALLGYVPRYRTFVAADTGATVQLVNLGQPGWTSAQLANALTSNSTFRYAVSNSRLITFNIGGNDLRSARSRYKNRGCGGADNQDCLRAGVVAFKSNWNRIIANILTLRHETAGNVRRTVIRTMDIYNPYVNEDKAADSWLADGGLNDFQAMKPYLDDVNAHIAATSAAAGIEYARVYRAFNGSSGDIDPEALGYISFDGLHPNDRGHRVMAEQLRILRYLPLKD
jgi:lysophospholipase L1-like esterase